MSAEVRKKKAYVRRNLDEIEVERQCKLEEQRAAGEAGHLKAEEAAARQCAEGGARKTEEATRTKAIQEAAAIAGAEPAVVADVAVAEPVTEPTAMEECKKEEPRRVPKHDEDDDRHDRKHIQHHSSVKEKGKVPAPRVAPCSIGEESDGYHYGDRGDKSELKKCDQHEPQNPIESIVREVNIGETITVAGLAAQMSVRGARAVRFMFKMDSPVAINQVLDQETVQLAARELGYKVKLVSENVLEEQLTESLRFEGEAVTRTPAIAVMGYTDHSRTSLLDYICRARAAAGEAGSIIQHIGVYYVETERDMVTFLDIPGHIALTTMCVRGAQVTDIAILVVATDDGAMPQTQEVVQRVKAVGVSIVVTVSKVDKSKANPDNIKNGLIALGMTPEEWGGDTPFVPVSAKLGTGVDELFETVPLRMEVFELKTTPSVPDCDVVVGSRPDKGRGPMATVLAQDGTLRQDDVALVGINYGHVRAILNENGKPTRGTGPSTPVEIPGLDGTPDVGDEVTVIADERKVREVALFCQGKFREVKLARAHVGKLENIFESMGQEEKKTLNIVLRANVRGPFEALQGSFSDLGNGEVQVRVAGDGVGDITESDTNLALVSNVVLLDFNMRANAGTCKIVEVEGPDTCYYNVIYDIIENVKGVLTGMLDSDLRENILGIAEVHDVLRSPKLGVIAGCMVTEGMVHRNRPTRVLCDDVVILEGELESLRCFKDGVTGARVGTEYDIGAKSYDGAKVGDGIEVPEKVGVACSL